MRVSPISNPRRASRRGAASRPTNGSKRARSYLASTQTFKFPRLKFWCQVYTVQSILVERVPAEIDQMRTSGATAPGLSAAHSTLCPIPCQGKLDGGAALVVIGFTGTQRGNSTAKALDS